jgi:hypothetical protein
MVTVLVIIHHLNGWKTPTASYLENFDCVLKAFHKSIQIAEHKKF